MQTPQASPSPNSRPVVSSSGPQSALARNPYDPNLPVATHCTCPRQVCNTTLPRSTLHDPLLPNQCNKGPHRDLNNADAPSFLTCLSQQSGGDLWIHSAQGAHPMCHAGQVLHGVVAPIKQSPILFRSRAQIHCCTPWRNGPRTTLTAFTTLNVKSAPDSLRHSALKHLDLPFPSAEDLAAWSTEAKAKAKRELTRRAPLEPNQSSILDYVRTSVNRCN